MATPDSLRVILEEVVRSCEPHATSPRSLLSHYGYLRRGRHNNAEIRAALREYNVITEPDFESAYIDGRIAIVCVRTAAADAQTEPAVGETTPPVSLVSGGSVVDPVGRIRQLAAANRKPVFVSRDHTTREAITIMLINDFSQLPVMGNERDVYGMISWRSIGRARSLNRSTEYVRDCMEDYTDMPDSTPLLDALAIIAAREAVLVRASDRRIVGLVTTSDLSLEFRTQAEPFLLLAEIENHLRRLIDGKYTTDAIAAVRDPMDAGREIEAVSDLTFGEYIRLLQQEEHWNRLGVDLDRGTFCGQLDKIRQIRNDVMHFNPDGTSTEDLETLRDMVRLLQRM